jgi:hypothetical protein
MSTTHTTFFGKLIAAIGGFFAHLVTGAKSAYDELPADQQQAIINGVSVSQIIKDGYKRGEDYVVNTVAQQAKISPGAAVQLIFIALADIGIKKDSIQDGLNTLADMIGKGITDNDYNGLWKGLATSAAQWLSSGKLDWISLSMGLIEWAVQHFIKSGANVQ